MIGGREFVEGRGRDGVATRAHWSGEELLRIVDHAHKFADGRLTVLERSQR